jgi:prophage tail gpP-like protein
MRFRSPEARIKLSGQSDIYSGRRLPPLTISGFTGFQVVRAIDAAADAFAFSLPWDPADYEKIPLRPFLKNTAQIEIDGAPMLLGYIEKLVYGYSDDGRMIEIQGRGATGVSVEWSAGALYDPSGKEPEIMTEFRGMKFNQIADLLYIPGGIFARPNIGPFGDEAVADPKQSLFDFLQSLAATAGLWAVPRPNGLLEFKKLGDTPPVADLEEGTAPLLSVSASHDSTKRARWYLLAITQWGDPITVASAVDVTAEPAIRGTRILPEPQQAAADYTELVNQARSRAIMDGYEVAATTTGFGPEPGKLWAAGDVVRILSPSAFIMRPTEYIIRRTTFQFDEIGGATTTLDLAFPELFTGRTRPISRYPFN